MRVVWDSVQKSRSKVHPYRTGRPIRRNALLGTCHSLSQYPSHIRSGRAQIWLHVSSLVHLFIPSLFKSFSPIMPPLTDAKSCPSQSSLRQLICPYPSGGCTRWIVRLKFTVVDSLHSSPHPATVCCGRTLGVSATARLSTARRYLRSANAGDLKRLDARMADLAEPRGLP